MGLLASELQSVAPLPSAAPAGVRRPPGPRRARTARLLLCIQRQAQEQGAVGRPGGGGVASMRAMQSHGVGAWVLL